jgi:hypothetical protein
MNTIPLERNRDESASFKFPIGSDSIRDSKTGKGQEYDGSNNHPPTAQK